MMGATDAFKACADAWSPIMDCVHMSVTTIPTTSAVPDAGRLGYIRAEVTDPARSCIMATVVEVRLEHLGSAVDGKPTSIVTKNLALALKQLSGAGDLRMSFTKGESYKAKSMATYSMTEFDIPVMEVIGTQAVIPKDKPATIKHVVNLNVSEIKSFMTCLATMGAEYFDIRIQSDGQRVAMTIQGESDKTANMTAKRTFFGVTSQDPAAAAAASTSSPLAVGGSGLRSARVLDLDESKLEQPIQVGESDSNLSREEIERAMARLRSAEKVVDSTNTFMLKFLHAFLSKLDLQSKLVMAVVETAGGATCLFLRSSTPKSVTEIMLAGALST